MSKTTRQSEVSLFIPGRLCLLGEHSDWAAEMGAHRGFCLVIGTDQGLRAVARPAERFTISTLVPGPRGGASGRTRQMECDWDRQSLLSTAKDAAEFFRYCAGVACQMIGRQGVSGAVEIRITEMDLPLRKGVSSSAAVCVLVAGGVQPGLRARSVPARVDGDRLPGREAHRQRMRADGPGVHLREDAGAADVREGSPGADRAGDARRRPSPVLRGSRGAQDTVKILSDLRRAIGGAARFEGRWARRTSGSSARRTALTTGNARRLGSLMLAAQELFDRQVAPHSAAELASPLLHRVLAAPAVAGHIWGGKGVGSQGDGTRAVRRPQRRRPPAGDAEDRAGIRGHAVLSAGHHRLKTCHKVTRPPPSRQAPGLARADARAQDVLGVMFDLVDYREVLASVDRWRRAGASEMIMIHNPNAVMTCRHDREMAEVTGKSALVLPDGVGVVLAARILGYAHKGRVSGPTLLLKLCDWGRAWGAGTIFTAETKAWRTSSPGGCRGCIPV